MLQRLRLTSTLSLYLSGSTVIPELCFAPTFCLFGWERDSATEAEAGRDRGTGRARMQNTVATAGHRRMALGGFRGPGGSGPPARGSGPALGPQPEPTPFLLSTPMQPTHTNPTDVQPPPPPPHPPAPAHASALLQGLGRANVHYAA